MCPASKDEMNRCGKEKKLFDVIFNYHHWLSNDEVAKSQIQKFYCPLVSSFHNIILVVSVDFCVE